MEFALPVEHKFILWAAESSQSLFESFAEDKRIKKNQKYLLYEEEQKAEHPLNTLWPMLSLSEEAKQVLFAVKPFVLESFALLQTKIITLLRIKEDFLLEVYKLGNIIDTKILPVIPPRELIKSLVWMESKKFEKEFSIVSLFKFDELALLEKLKNKRPE